MVVRLDAGRDAVRAYVDEQAAKGRGYVVALLRDDRDTIVSLIFDLSDLEAKTQPAAGEWSIAETMNHVNASFKRSLDRIETLTAGKPFDNPLVPPGVTPDQTLPRFDDLRDGFVDGTNAVIAVLERADPNVGLDLTADHALLGPFNWLQWAVYSHHVHTHDHIGQIGEARAALGR